jgi:hypothetical protein
LRTTVSIPWAPFGDGRRIEHHQVDGEAGGDAAAVTQVHALGVAGGHAAHRLGEAEEAQVAHIAAEQAREVAVGNGGVVAVAGEVAPAVSASAFTLETGPGA